MKNSELLGSVEALGELAQRELAPAVSWKLAKLLKSVQGALEPYETVLKQLQDKYAGPEENGQRRVPPENVAEFTTKLNELLAQEPELSFTQFKLSDLGDAPIKSATLATLSWLISEE